MGLRAQIVLALTVAFLASFTLLGVATIQLSQTARDLDRRRDILDGATVLARALDGATDEESAFQAAAPLFLGHRGVTGIEWERPTGSLRVGQPGRLAADTKTHDGARLRTWYQPATFGSGTPVTNLLLLYVALTAGAILLLTYVSLTYLIVRPLESVTRASERLARGNAFASVPERGAAEVARLATAFNDMAAQLREKQARLEERLRDLERTTQDLRSAQAQVVRSEKLASVGRLSAGVAHEIGNPLAAILGMIELVRGGGLDGADEKEFLRRIQGETERIQKIIRDLLDYARQGTSAGTESTANLTEVVEDAVRLVTPQKDLRGVTLERRLATDVPAVRGAAHQITQVALNLLLNAADAIGGEGTIQVEVERDATGDAVTLTVSDSGPGIAPEVLGHLFEPFVTTKPPGEGTGLGLAVSQTIMESLGGSLRAENAEGGGARFIARFPVARAG